MRFFRSWSYASLIISVSKNIPASDRDRRKWAYRTGKDYGLDWINLWRLRGGG